MLWLGRLPMYGFLKARGVHEEVTLEVIERYAADLKACPGESFQGGIRLQFHRGGIPIFLA